jgi:hypothetical protein
MHLEGSCHCGAVTFSVEAYAPVPYMRCYCSICRKTAGGGGYAINIGAKADTLEVHGKEHISMFHAHVDGTESSGERRFCKHCGSQLWVSDPAWPELVHPHASAIDTPLPEPPAHVHILLDSKANWVEVAAGPDDETYEHYPTKSLEEWHREHNLLDED